MGNMLNSDTPLLSCTGNTLSSTCCNKNSVSRGSTKKKKTKQIVLYGWRFANIETNVQWFLDLKSCQKHAKLFPGKKSFYMWEIPLNENS